MNKLLRHLRVNWWMYLCAALIVVAVWLLLFNYVATPKPNQQIAITYVGTKLESSQLESDLYNFLQSATSQQINKVSVEVTLSDDDYMFTMLMATRILTKDLIIVDRSYVSETFCADYFLPLPQTVVDMFPDAEFYMQDGEIYGFCPSSDSTFARYYGGENNCCIFLCSYSVNAGQAYGKGEVGDDAALQTIKFLLSK